MVCGLLFKVWIILTKYNLEELFFCSTSVFSSCEAEHTQQAQRDRLTAQKCQANWSKSHEQSIQFATGFASSCKTAAVTIFFSTSVHFIECNFLKFKATKQPILSQAYCFMTVYFKRKMLEDLFTMWGQTKAGFTTLLSKITWRSSLHKRACPIHCPLCVEDDASDNGRTGTSLLTVLTAFTYSGFRRATIAGFNMRRKGPSFMHLHTKPNRAWKVSTSSYNCA